MTVIISNYKEPFSQTRKIKQTQKNKHGQLGSNFSDVTNHSTTTALHIIDTTMSQNFKHIYEDWFYIRFM